MNHLVTLYRTISWVEFDVLVRDKKVMGVFNREHDHSTYKKEYGSILCCFLKNRCYMHQQMPGLQVEIKVPVERIVADGIGSYSNYDPYDFILQQLLIKEVYIPYYTWDEVTILRWENEMEILQERSLYIKIPLNKEIPKVVTMDDHNYMITLYSDHFLDDVLAYKMESDVMEEPDFKLINLLPSYTKKSL